MIFSLHGCSSIFSHAIRLVFLSLTRTPFVHPFLYSFVLVIELWNNERLQSIFNCYCVPFLGLANLHLNSGDHYFHIHKKKSQTIIQFALSFHHSPSKHQRWFWKWKSGINSLRKSSWKKWTRESKQTVNINRVEVFVGKMVIEQHMEYSSIELIS